MVERLIRFHQLGKKLDGLNSPVGTAELVKEHRQSQDTLRKARAFARAYSSRDLEQLCNRRRPNGLPLQWGHVVALLSVQNNQKRKEFERLAADQGWTAPLLRAEIRKLYVKRSQTGAGRRVEIAKNPKAILQQILVDVPPWVARCQAIEKIVAPSSDDTGLAGGKWPAAKRVEEACKLLKELSRSSSQLADQLAKITSIKIAR
jgi:hypothetical protein